jgi:hypothetical protein
MIITADEYNRDISQLTSLLRSQNIKIVSVESSFEENMRSRHDWVERAVTSSNHFIFIVTKQMGEIFNSKFSKPSSEESGDRARLLTDYEGGTCAYTVTLIRNEFVKSLKYHGCSPKSCHLVSFDEEDEKVVSRLKEGLNLFQCIKTHCYHLYTGKRFRYNAACRIINNIKKTERSRGRKTNQKNLLPNPEPRDMDAEEAFRSVQCHSLSGTRFIPEGLHPFSQVNVNTTSDLAVEEQ